jgi:hypothetical protein
MTVAERRKYLQTQDFPSTFVFGAVTDEELARLRKRIEEEKAKRPHREKRTE